MAATSDRPAPASADDVSRLRRLLELKIKYTSEPASPWPALALDLCDSHESLRQLVAERDMETERLRAADVALSEKGVAAAWAVVDKHHGSAYQVPMTELLYAYLDAARAASRDEERDHG